MERVPFDLRISEVDLIKEPSNFPRVNAQKAKGIKRRTTMSKTFNENHWIYEVNLFGHDFVFCSWAGLRGCDIYDICEQMFINEEF